MVRLVGQRYANGYTCFYKGVVMSMCWVMKVMLFLLLVQIADTGISSYIGIISGSHSGWWLAIKLGQGWVYRDG